MKTFEQSADLSRQRKHFAKPLTFGKETGSWSFGNSVFTHGKSGTVSALLQGCFMLGCVSAFERSARKKLRSYLDFRRPVTRTAPTNNVETDRPNRISRSSRSSSGVHPINFLRLLHICGFAQMFGYYVIRHLPEKDKILFWNLS